MEGKSLTPPTCGNASGVTNADTCQPQTFSHLILQCTHPYIGATLIF